MTDPDPAATAPNAKMKIEFTDATKSLSAADLKWLTEHLTQAVGVLGAHGEVRVRVVGDDEMSQAHAEFSGVEGTTDVLTFDLSDPEENPNSEPAVELLESSKVLVRRIQGIDTDILTCFDEAARQARIHEVPITHELLLYSVHGVLHCLGFDDHEEGDFARMHAVEDAVLIQIGVGAVYRRDGGRTTDA